MAIAHIAIQCEDYIGSPDDGDGTVIIDTKDVNKAGSSVENAFLTGDSEKVKEIISASSLSLYSDLITNSSAENLKAFGNAFKSRELKVVSEKYAEFKFIVDGIEYTIAMSMDDDGSWKIMRL